MATKIGIDRVGWLFPLGWTLFFGGFIFGWSLPLKAGWQPLEKVSLAIVVIGAICLVADGIISHRRFKKQWKDWL